MSFDREKTLAGAKKIWHWLTRCAEQWRVRSPRHLRLCETLTLGERRFVAVVQFEEQKFLIGGTGTSLALLAQLPATPQELPPLVAGEVSLKPKNREAVQ